MLYQIIDGSVSAGGCQVLSHINFEIRGAEKIGVVGRNGAGKTTLLRLLAGELSLDRDDKREGAGVRMSRQVTVGMLRQQWAGNSSRTVEEELLEGCPDGDLFSRERFAYEQEYDRLFTGLGFSKADKKKQLREFSGGEQAKIGLIRLLLEKPDILLLDEPTNHLDLETVQWLEQYLKSYEHAVVMVSHDRFFLDQTVETVYEVSQSRLTRYAGNYSDYRREKQKKLELARKAYERQQAELARLEKVVERFKHKPSKASFARAKKKQMERMEWIEKPQEDEIRLFVGEINPLVPGGKWVFTAHRLRLGYESMLLELSLRIRRGQKIGVIGPNGAGKSTFLKTAAGLLPPLGGEWSLGNHVIIGYFDQHSAEISSKKTVLEHFGDQFPGLTEKEARQILASFLFGGKEASRRVCDLSGGEKARLVLAELLHSRPNFLILDEPTNHMDIQAKEVLESAFQAYRGTILFVSHDRYFIRQVAESVLIFQDGQAMYYPFGYVHYLEKSQALQRGEDMAARVGAEDARLLTEMQAVPRAERRERALSEEEAYADWRLRLVMERLEPAGERVGFLENEIQEEEKERQETENFWNGEESREACEERAALRSAREKAWELWHRCCLEWWDVFVQTQPPGKEP